METSAETVLTRQEASDAVGELGWRYLLGALRTSVAVASLTRAAEVAAVAVAACGGDGDQHLFVDLRPTHVTLTLQTLPRATVTAHDVTLAARISTAVSDMGLRTGPGIEPPASPRSVQILEFAVDAMDIAAVRPFWRAVLGYVAEPGADGPQDPLVDPLGQGPALWFQQMDHPRPQRNRIHFDVCVPHDEVAHRIEATLAAGGRLVYEAEAPAFRVLADPEGNEVCVTTWQGRD
ncbi:VOC family protein [Streptomyces sp. NPDC051561]|uniref:VOC family protein n=1 Tax=Streptomyces sp. NPDC051561 TaxID=3365658 RepID=UPI0037B2CE42